ncbi:hypothetical protein ACWCXB_17590 [Streptomyces sp. NPDC001514]
MDRATASGPAMPMTISIQQFERLRQEIFRVSGSTLTAREVFESALHICYDILGARLVIASLDEAQRFEDAGTHTPTKAG